MKKAFISAVFVLICLAANCQSIESQISYVEQIPTSMYLYEYVLGVDKTTDIDALKQSHNYPFEKKEFEWAVRYATLYADECQQYDSNMDYEYVRDALDNFCRYGYTSPLSINVEVLPRDYSEIGGVEDYMNLRHNRLLQNKTFRQFAMGVAKKLIKEIVSYYPKDYKLFLSKQMQYALDFIDEIPNHNYHVGWEENEYGYGWLELYDGEEVSSQTYGIEGIILRRILLNKIPIEEVRSMVTEIKSVVDNVDNSENPEIMAIYKLNDDLGICFGCNEPYFMSYIPHDEFNDKEERKVMYSKYEPFHLDFAERLKGWGCNYNILIRGIEHYKEDFQYHNEEGNLVNQQFDMYVYDFLPPQYGFGHCFVENNVSKLEIDGRFRIHHKLY